MVLLIVYVFFLYTAQETLLPTVISSLTLYGLVVCTVFNVVVFQKGNGTLPQYTKWYVCLIILGLFSFAWASNIVFEAMYNMIVSLVVTYCFIIILDTSDKFDVCIRSFVFAADVMGILLILTGQLTGSAAEDRLGESITGNANSFSALLMVAAVLAIWLAIYKAKTFPDKMFNISSFLFILFMMALSGGRKTILAVIVCMLIFIVFKNRISFFNFMKNAVIAIAAVVVLYNVMMNVPIFYESVGQRFEGIFNWISEGTSSVGSDKLRNEMIEIGLDQWKNRPVLGYGLDTFKYYNQITTGHFYYAHNNFVELLYDVGIVGFTLYYGYICKLGYSLFKEKNENLEYKILGLALLTELLIYDMGGVSYYTVMMQIVICMAYLCFKYSKRV